MNWVVGESLEKSKAQRTRNRCSNRSSRSNRSKCWAWIDEQELTIKDTESTHTRNLRVLRALRSGVPFSEVFAVGKKWPINDFSKFLGPESHDVNGFLSAINEEYFYE
jgi:hypothetical protein